MRWGLAGHGDLAERKLVPVFRADGRELFSVWGRDLVRVSNFSRRHKIARVTTDIDQLCVGVDAIYVATPVCLHVEIAEKALSAGCHVIIEKPVSPGLRRTHLLAELSDRLALSVGVAYYRRLLPVVRRVRSLLASGVLGRVVYISVRFCTPFDPNPGDPKLWRTDLALAGAGVLADAGSHRLDLLCWIFGPPRMVSAVTSRHFSGGSERKARLHLTWSGDLIAECIFEWDQRFVDHLSFETDRGVLTLDSLDKGHLSWKGVDGEWTEDHPSPENSHLALIRDFENAVATGNPPACTLAEGVRVDCIIENALISSACNGVELKILEI